MHMCALYILVVAENGKTSVEVLTERTEASQLDNWSDPQYSFILSNKLNRTGQVYNALDIILYMRKRLYMCTTLS